MTESAAATKFVVTRLTRGRSVLEGWDHRGSISRGTIHAKPCRDTNSIKGPKYLKEPTAGFV